ncbi:SEC-C metal-binding domain-containing protein [Spirosoma aerophilum]
MASGIELFRQESININDHFPSLNYSEEENGLPFIYGNIPLHDTEGELIDNYSVKIVPTDEYPSKLPFVFETGGRIPINIDWHVFSDGHCCLMPFPQETLTCKKGIKLANFIEKEVVPYFYNQKHRELYGYFLKERSHGNKGHTEFFQDKFNSTDPMLIAKGLRYIAQHKEPKNTDKCFCGSGSKYGKCHRQVFRELSLFSEQELLIYAKLVLNEF